MTREASIGWIGPTEDSGALRHACQLLLDSGVDQVIYLGQGAQLQALTQQWAVELGGANQPFLSRVVDVAERGSPAEIAQLLQSDLALRSLTRLRTLPPPPTRAIEMLSGRIVMAVHDKKVLDEEDIANASIIVFGESTAWLFKRFGPRYFLTPGPLKAGRIAVLEDDGDSHVALVALDANSGEELERQVLHGASSRMTVTG